MLFAGPAVALKAGDTVPAVNFLTADGSESLASLKGSVVYIDFWASWCVPCRISFPWMNAMQEKYADRGLRIISVNLDQEASLADQFLQNHPAGFTVSFDPQGLLAEKFKVVGMPTALLIGRDGIVRSRHIGFRNDKKHHYESALIAALAE